MVERKRLSKFLSYVLRHNPLKFGIELDKEGFADLDKITELLSAKFPGINKETIIEVVRTSPKKRFEIIGGRIRAVYGHSIEIDLNLPEVEPPEILYHGTSRKAAGQILKSGLRKMTRQFVHLSITDTDAYQVGLRKDSKPVVLEIRARDAYCSGIKFYRSGNLYLTKEIPIGFISTKVTNG